MKMKWYHYMACFFAGVFFANVIPHYIHGVSGDSFPSPFANPPGVGLSPPIQNVVWALINLIIGYFLYKAGKVSRSKWALLVFFIGFAAMSMYLGVYFAGKMTDN